MSNRRTKTGQSVDFMQRIIVALDADYVYLAHRIDVPVEDISAMLKGSRSKLIAVDQDEVFAKIATYVDTQIGMLMSVREELQRKLTQDRQERLMQRLRIENR
jgi:plasmid maintenance system antidote protein VapI